MKYGLYLPNFGAFGTARVMADLAYDAEQAGWDGFFIWDHVARPIIYDLVDPWIAMTAIAMNTETIKFGAMVTPLARRRPQVLARESVSLDVLSGGRLILGVGLGSGRPQEFANFDEETDMKIRAKMTDEALDVIAALWSGEVVNHEGEFYTARDSQFLPRPISRPRIPIWIAGYYPYKKPMQRASRWDGMYILYDEAEDKVEALRETIAYIKSQRTDNTLFDYVFQDPIPTGSDRMTMIENAQKAHDAGATWWLTNIDPRRYDFEWDSEWDFDLMRQTILDGPPVTS
ncbi:MAG: LLM class flavin-dependent oxidoreductase [Chloroflexota bacterium]